MRARALGGAALVGLLLAAAPASAVPSSRLVTLRDPRITESSGLVDLGSTLVTTNDSGSDATLFVVSATTGRTVGVTRFGAPVRDVEALAPAGRGAVWVGDIGDNRASRSSVTIYRVPVASGDHTVRAAAYRFAYPRGRHDAESLVVDRAGRLHLITKSFEGGTVYRAPLRPSRTRVNPLVLEGRVLEYATDAAMLPDGRHVLVRGLGLIGVYEFPSFRRIGSFSLPRQRQGEGLSVGRTGRLLLSSEGAHTSVLRITLPPEIQRRLRPAPRPTPSASPSPTPSPTAGSTPSPSPTPTASPAPGPSSSPRSAGEASSAPRAGVAGDPERSEQPWLLWSIPAVIAVGALGIGVALRRRSD